MNVTQYTETLILPSGAKPLEMVAIPGGTFKMGSPESETDFYDGDESPQHQVTVPGFFMGRYTVTQAQWFAVMSDYNANGWQEKWRSLDSKFKGDNFPITIVSWDDAIEFCDRLSAKTGKIYTLPSEAQWEYACRGGTDTPYSFGDDAAELGNYAWYYGNSGNETHPVKQKKPNAWGLYDMHGNVWEWCADQWHDCYSKKPNADAEDWRVLRGGSWFNYARNCRSANRGRGTRASWNYGSNGFRVCVG